MSILRLREFCFVLGIGLLTVLTFGCVDPDEGNGYGGGMVPDAVYRETRAINIEGCIFKDRFNELDGL